MSKKDENSKTAIIYSFWLVANTLFEENVKLMNKSSRLGLVDTTP